MSDVLLLRRLWIAGVLTDAASVVLRDPTNTYGIRRADTLAVAVASGTAMNHDSTGQYSYTATGLVAGVSYQWATRYTLSTGDTVDRSGSFVAQPDPTAPTDLTLCRCQVTNYLLPATYRFEILNYPQTPIGGFPVLVSEMDAIAGGVAYGDLPRGSRARVTKDNGRGLKAHYDFDVPSNPNFVIDHSLLADR